MSTPRPTLLKRLALLGALALLFLPPIQTLLNMKIFRAGGLGGYAELAPKPTLTWAGLRDNTYQPALESYLADHLGFRHWFIRPRNQVAYSLFGEAKVQNVLLGKDGMLFEETPIQAYLGQDFVGENVVQANVAQFRALQDTLARRGKLLLFVIAPNKASFFPEYLPPKYRNLWVRPSNYEAYARQMRASGINLLDFSALFRQWKDTASYPLFTRVGIHWSGYGITRAADTLFRYIEQRGRLDLPDFQSADLEISSTPRYTDDDIARALNLVWTPGTGPLAYPNIVFQAPKPQQRQPRLLVVGDSFVYSFIEFYPYLDSLFAQDSHFWYYNQEVVWRKLGGKIQGETQVTRLNRRAELAKHDVVMVMFTEHNLAQFDQGFAADALQALSTP